MIIPGWKNTVIAASGRFMPHEWLTRVTARLLRPVKAPKPHSFAFVADARGLHAEHTFTVRPATDGLSTFVASDETQIGLLPRLGRVFLRPRLHAANQAWLADLARAAELGARGASHQQQREM